LRAAAVEVWFDQSELRGGDAWDAAIRKQIKTCALFIPIISKNTHAREEGYFRFEWKLAVDRSHLMTTSNAFLLPVIIDDNRDDDQVPDKFREVQWTQLPSAEQLRLHSLSASCACCTTIGTSRPRRVRRLALPVHPRAHSQFRSILEINAGAVADVRGACRTDWLLCVLEVHVAEARRGEQASVGAGL
jgi:hypothetical protein